MRNTQGLRAFRLHFACRTQRWAKTWKRYTRGKQSQDNQLTAFLARSCVSSSLLGTDSADIEHVVATDEGVAILVLELPVHVLLCLFHCNVHVAIEARQHPPVVHPSVQLDDNWATSHLRRHGAARQHLRQNMAPARSDRARHPGGAACAIPAIGSCPKHRPGTHRAPSHSSLRHSPPSGTPLATALPDRSHQPWDPSFSLFQESDQEH